MHTILRRLAIALSIVVISTSTMAAGAQDCTLTQYASVGFGVFKNSEIIFPIIIANTVTDAVLNLSSGISTMAPSAVTALKLDAKTLRNTTTFMVGDQKFTKYPEAPAVMGIAHFSSKQFLITTEIDPSLTAVDPRVKSHIGMDMFSGVDIEIDFANRKLNLYSQDHCPGAGVYWTADPYSSIPIRRGTVGEPYLIMEVDGHRIETAIGTGGSISRLSEDAASKIFGIDLGPQPNTRVARREQFMDFTANGVAVMDAQVQISDSPSKCRIQEKVRKDGAAGYDNCGNTYPLRLGLNVLQKMHIYIANKENMLYFTAADAHK